MLDTDRRRLRPRLPVVPTRTRGIRTCACSRSATVRAATARARVHGPVPARGEVRPRGRVPARHRHGTADGARRSRSAHRRELHAALRGSARAAPPRRGAQTLFHELGHILHQGISQAEFARFTASETEADFVEAPSQIMEHWAWDPTSSGVRAPPRDVRADPDGAGGPARRQSRNLNVGLKTAAGVFRHSTSRSTAEPRADLDAIIRVVRGDGLPFHEGTFFSPGSAT